MPDALLAREREDGRLELIDGHLRAETTPDAVVPVLVLDLDDSEAAALLAVLDPLAAMAKKDTEAFEALTRQIEFENDALNELIAHSADAPIDMPSATPLLMTNPPTISLRFSKSLWNATMRTSSGNCTNGWWVRDLIVGW